MSEPGFITFELSPSEAEYLGELEERHAMQPTGWLYRPDLCLACGQFRTAEGHDPCIANLPGVDHACCGHGLPGWGVYMMMVGGHKIDLLLYGPAAARKLRELGGNPPPAAFQLDPVFGAAEPPEIGYRFTTLGIEGEEPQAA